MKKIDENNHILTYNKEENLWSHIDDIKNMGINLLVTIKKHDFSLIWKCGDDLKLRHYQFALSDYPNISQWELGQIIKLCEYENNHKRKVAFWCETINVEEKIIDALSNSNKFKNVDLPYKITGCTACKQKGCLTDFLCHTASLENAKSIMDCGKLLSAVNARKTNAEVLSTESRNAAGDPLDYFNYIMFSWGNCQAGDRLVMERLLERLPTEDDLSMGFHPGIRFYFKYNDLVSHPNAKFDGYHPLKIKDELFIADYLYACIIPLEYKTEFQHIIPENILDKTYFVDNNCKDIWEWSKKVYEFVQSK